MRYRLSWRDHGDRLDVAVLAHRAARHGIDVAWCEAREKDFEAGDYALDVDASTASQITRGGFELREATAAPGRMKRLSHPPIALLCGEVSDYPYFGFYTLCLLRLGLTYRPVAGADIASGALAGRAVLVLPGGFATWGLDAGEGAPGADAAVRDFLAAGGGCIGSCGGAFYLSAGRPGWTGTVNAVPRWTHEYLQSGAAVVSVEMAHDVLRTGLPPSIELPYYHGPIYEAADFEQAVNGLPDNATRALGHFRAPCLQSRLMIDNPLEADRFERTHAGRVAIVRSEGLRGRAVLFSPHPEMGDVMRKYMALDGYVRRYLPVRGEKTMEETLRFYRPLDAPAFRLVGNAVHWLDRGPGDGPVHAEVPVVDAVDTGSVERCARAHLERRARETDDAVERLVRGEADRIGRRLGAVIPRLGDMLERADRELVCDWHHAAARAMGRMETASARLESSAVLLDVDLLTSIAEACVRLAEVDTMLVS